MSKILEEFHQKYIPTQPSEGSMLLPNGNTLSFDSTTFFRTLLGGDQLTVACGRETVALRASHDTPHDRLEGVEFNCEDWHCRQVLMRVSTLAVRHSMRGLLKTVSVIINDKKWYHNFIGNLEPSLHQQIYNGERDYVSTQKSFKPDHSTIWSRE